MSPYAPPRSCAIPTCGALAVSGGRCLTHQLRERDRPNEDVRRWYRTPRWQALRAQKFAEDPLCWECRQEGRLEPWTDLDHIVPHRGNPKCFWDNDNVRGLCRRHHAQKTKRGQ